MPLLRIYQIRSIEIEQNIHQINLVFPFQTEAEFLVLIVPDSKLVCV